MYVHQVQEQSFLADCVLCLDRIQEEDTERIFQEGMA